MYYDYHTHTCFSEDSEAPVDSMIQGAIAKGICELAITDHYDPDYPDPEYDFIPDFPEYHKMLTEKQAEYAGKIKIVKGLEIGLQEGALDETPTMEKALAAANAFPYDFLIGSFHCFCGYDLYTADYSKMEEKQVLPDFYTHMYNCLKAYKNYDIVGHFNVVDRYVPFELDYSNCMDIVEAILKMIIEDGKGIELNTSSFRYGMGERTHASSEILTMYREMGGEIVTMGSDAHKPEDLADHFDRAREILTGHGFRYFATFEDRKIKMVKF